MKLTAQFDHLKILADETHQLKLVITAQAPTVDVATTRKPLNIIAVIDESGSMAGDKIDYVQKSIRKLIEHMSPEDRLGLVGFSDGVWTIFEPALMDPEQKTKFVKKTYDLKARSMTNLSSAVLTGLSTGAKLDAQTRVILFTDGQPTCGETNADRIVGLLKNRQQAVTFSAFGYGNDHDQNLLEAMAKAGDGNYFYVKSPDEALKAFAMELGGLISCYAQQLKFRIMPKPGAKITKVVSDVDSKELDGGAVEISVPDLYSQEARHLVFDIEVPEHKAMPRGVTLFDVEVAYTDVGTGVESIVMEKAKVEFVKDRTEVQLNQSQMLIDQIALAKFFTAQAAAIDAADAGQYVLATQSIDAVSKDVIMTKTSAAIRSFVASSATAYTADQWAKNRGEQVSSKMSYTRGRASSVDANALYASNDAQDLLIKSFVGVADGTPPINAADKGTTVTFTSAETPVPTDTKPPTKASLTKSRSTKSW